jgi:hypothetical protein
MRKKAGRQFAGLASKTVDLLLAFWGNGAAGTSTCQLIIAVAEETGSSVVIKRTARVESESAGCHERIATESCRYPVHVVAGIGV